MQHYRDLKRVCLHQSVTGKLFAAFAVLSSTAAIVTHILALMRGSAFLVGQGFRANWGQIVMLGILIYVLPKTVCTAERVLFGSWALICTLIVITGSVPLLSAVPGILWRVMSLVLSCAAATAAVQILVNRAPQTQS
jgi:hypothetical protein